MAEDVGASGVADVGAVGEEDDVVDVVVVASGWTSMGYEFDGLAGIGRSGRGHVVVVVAVVVVGSSLAGG